jgi:hypothetical protein
MDKNWGLIAALVPGRTQKQCWCRWHDTLGIPAVTGRMDVRVIDWKDKKASCRMRYNRTVTITSLVRPLLVIMIESKLSLGSRAEPPN